MKKIHLTHRGVEIAANGIANYIAVNFSIPSEGGRIKIFPVPRGGVPVAYLLLKFKLPNNAYLEIVDSADEADIIIDDLIDTGATRKKYRQKFPTKPKPFLALFTKDKETGIWHYGNNKLPEIGCIVFPWESDSKSNNDTPVGTALNLLWENKIDFKGNSNIVHANVEFGTWVFAHVEETVESLLDCLLIDWRNDPNMKETPLRFAKMLVNESFAGRFVDAPKITVFPNTNELDEIIISGPITVRSTCSHHLCPVFGKAWIGYIPGENVIGLSKFSRLIDWIAARPQIQEEMGVQIADEFERLLRPKAFGLILKLTHTCMTQRGVKETHESAMTTSIMRGVFRTNAEARSEFLNLIK